MRIDYLLFITPLLTCYQEPLIQITETKTTLAGPEPQSRMPIWSMQSGNGMVATAHTLATQAGVEIMQKGGNAADAALAIQWMLNVVEPQSSGIGGGTFILYYSAKTNSVIAIDGREESPHMPENIFLDQEGNPRPFYPDRITGGHASGVPGTVAAMRVLFEKYGSKKIRLEETFQRAIQAATQGIRVSGRLSAAMKFNEPRLKKDPYTASTYLKNNSFYKEGEIFIQKDLSRTFQKLAQNGLGTFYQLEMANKISTSVKYNRHSAGYIKPEDIVNYQAIEKIPVMLRIGNSEIYSFPPPGSGITVLQTIYLLTQSNRQNNDIGFIRKKIEAEKLAFADRHFYIEDPDFSNFSMEKLLDSNHLSQMKQVSGSKKPFPSSLFMHSNYEPARNLKEGDNTTHFSLMDMEGNAVAVTSTIEFSMGAGYAVANLGFLMNNQLTDFDPLPGKNNSYQKKKAYRKKFSLPQYYTYASRKKPRSSMSPIIIIENKQAVFAAGSPGGTFIPGTISQVAYAYLTTGKDIQQIVNEPRALFRGDDLVHLESPFLRNDNLIKALKSEGYRVSDKKEVNFGAVQAVTRKGTVFYGAADPRREGTAMGAEP